MPEQGGGGGKNEPEQLRKMFIGGLDYNTKDDGLKEFYEQWGTVVDVVVMKDPKTRRSRGFGFITYSEAYMVDDAMANRPHNIDGRQVEPKRAVPRDLCGKVDSNVRKLFIGGLGKNIEKEDLEEYFGRFGKLTDCAIVVTKDTGEKRGFGFVEYEDVDSADKVVLMKEHELKGRRVEVKKAIAREEIRNNERASGGGGGGGRGGRDRGDDRRGGDRGGRGGRDDYRGGNDSWNSNGSNNWGGNGGGGGYSNPWGSNGGGGGGNWGGNNMGGGNAWNTPWAGQGGFPSQGFNNMGMNPMMGMGNMGGMGTTPAAFQGGYNTNYGTGGYNSQAATTGATGGYNTGGYNSGSTQGAAGGGYNSGATGGYGGATSPGGGTGAGGPMRSNYNSSQRSAPYNTSSGGGGGGGGYGNRGASNTGGGGGGGRYQ